MSSVVLVTGAGTGIGNLTARASELVELDVTAPARTRRGRGRRPADEVRADVLHAVGELLLAEGMAELTFERVAKLAGVSKTTLHKWWPSRGALALDGYFHAVADTLAFADTGDLRADLVEQLRAFAHVLTGTPGGRVLAELIGQAQTDPELSRSFRALYSAQRRGLAADRLRRAQERGQLRAGVDVRVLIDQLWGAVYHRLLIPDEPITEEFVHALVANLLDGVG
ncbi:TetR/AcrR family transcriptional regulator C-terminal ligand-binding domain-containing protein [Crossiella sp. SN42]|uniref:TetR/AcrR family transcriptional regulator n=1 Tax=Crossiella sp. SN42 TaxID=2944808 RepID=UPI00207D339F|nr:TetR/AcrR family transcriptional regulator [Crossiella sp. SN42]MCO1574729.1 TetR/AcrR family transcriptional regulator C-terminal ligand-binding domain-containing protein [Crossiella sp. SN42]